MGWWPSSGTSADNKSQSQAQPLESIPPSNANLPESPQPPLPPPTSAPHDPDFYAAYPHLAPPSLSTPPPSTSTNTDTSAQPNTSPSTPSGEDDDHLPRSMSCRAAFDSAFYCSSLGGHFNDIYRYGQLRSCNDHWNDFWFCMRTKNSYNTDETKQRMIQDRYREKEQKVRSGPSSEDVWRVRRRGEEVVGAFGAGNGDA